MLGALVERRLDHAEKEKERVTALKHQVADAEEKLTRLYRAIENGLADLDDSNLKGRSAELKRIRDSARVDVERAESRDARSASITLESINEFARMARQRLRKEDGTFRRNHIQSLVQRAEVGSDQIVIRGSALKLLQTLAEVSGGKLGVETAAHGVRSFVPNWLPVLDSNQRQAD